MKPPKLTPKAKLIAKYPDSILEKEEEGQFHIYLKTKSCHFKLGSGKTLESAYQSSLSNAGIK